MKGVNRMIAHLRPKKAYLDWINSLPGMDETPLALEDILDDATSYLIPEFETNEEGLAYVAQHAEAIFEIEFGGWDESGELWPEPLDAACFEAFFGFDVHSHVVDMVKAPIEREDYFE